MLYCISFVLLYENLFAPFSHFLSLIGWGRSECVGFPIYQLLLLLIVQYTDDKMNLMSDVSMQNQVFFSNFACGSVVSCH